VQLAERTRGNLAVAEVPVAVPTRVVYAAAGLHREARGAEGGVAGEDAGSAAVKDEGPVVVGAMDGEYIEHSD
jgi:hypothetical protein